MPEPCENGHALVNNCVYYAHQTREIYQVLPYSVDFKAPLELWNLLSKTVLTKYSFIWNKGHVNIWNGRKAQKLVERQTSKYFPLFLTLHNCTTWIN